MKAWKTTYGRVPIVRLVELQWSHADEGVEDRQLERLTSRLLCFNGATPMKAWKTLREQGVRRAQGHASMEPRR